MNGSDRDPHQYTPSPPSPQDVTQTRGVPRSNVTNPRVAVLNPPKPAAALQLLHPAVKEKRRKRASEADDHSSLEEVRGRPRDRYLLLQFQMEAKKHIDEIVAGGWREIMSSL